MSAGPPSDGRLCNDPACQRAGYHRHWVEPGHALAACLFDITHDGPPNEADLSALPPGWRQLVRLVQKRCEASSHRTPDVPPARRPHRP
ncbi:hypothetical protein GCM10023317_27450 [Actinopolymorpha pittospori]|uniref:Uncharacterized protein n=1 Tax=Actinopolymorpha pittospori TaxID=648752 RepID=A0A927MS72_9ACTN|nr:hypothetical protein [Actinopolymorpha pittospori]